MHYIRLLSPIRLTPPNKQQPPQISAKVAITTDLADAFFAPDQPVHLAIVLLPQRIILTHDSLRWPSGTRALKIAVPVPRGAFSGAQPTTTICIALAPGQTVPRQAGGLAEVMQVYASVDEHTQHRKLRIGQPIGQGNGAPLEIGEQMGESIALHIWDAATAMLGLFERLPLFWSSGGGDGDGGVAGMPLLEGILGSTKGVRILELGCGVGVLGLGIAKLLGTLPHRQGHVLLTDLPAAEETARANIARWVATQKGPSVAYTNLDWESVAAGHEQEFLAANGPWDLIILSDCTYNDAQFGNLVATLDQVHAVGNAQKETRVLLGTKPRHESEATFFGMIQEASWVVMEQTQVPIKGAVGTGGEEQHVKIFLYQKGHSNPGHNQV